MTKENIDSNNHWEESLTYLVDGNHRMHFFEKKAAELGVTVGYFIAEFL